MRSALVLRDARVVCTGEGSEPRRSADSLEALMDIAAETGAAALYYNRTY